MLVVEAVLVRDHTPGFVRDVAVDVVDFFASRTCLVRDGELVELARLDAVRISPGVTRALEAGDAEAVNNRPHELVAL